jgi:hypothetical protein
MAWATINTEWTHIYPPLFFSNSTWKVEKKKTITREPGQKAFFLERYCFSTLTCFLRVGWLGLYKNIKMVIPWV